MDLRSLQPSILTPILRDVDPVDGGSCSCGAAYGAGSGGGCQCGTASGGGA